MFADEPGIIPYAQEPVVGCLEANRLGDRIVITARPTLVRVVRILFPLWVTSGLTLVIWLAAMSLGSGRFSPSSWQTLLILGIGVVLSLSKSVTELFELICQPSFEASPEGIRFRSRRPTKIFDQQLGKCIAVARLVRDQGISLARPAVVLVFEGGAEYPFFYGTVAETRYLARMLCEGMGVPPSPDATIARRWWQSAVHLTPQRSGLILSIAPRYRLPLTIAGGLIAFACAFTILWLTENLVFDIHSKHFGPAIVAPPAALIIVAGTMWAMISQFGRSTAIHLSIDTVTIEEGGLRPGRVELATQECLSFQAVGNRLTVKISSDDPNASDVHIRRDASSLVRELARSLNAALHDLHGPPHLP